jgi:uroporphyrin-III C-methyltransferase
MRAGKVYLIGAGPGDPDLITVRGLELLRRADVVVYDRLVHSKLVNKARPGAKRIFAGKLSGVHSLPQEEINRKLVNYARKGFKVARLKGGDPLVFGRGGEEAQALRAAGVSYEIVPGVSSAIAAPAYAGIPVTHRGISSSFTVVTGHEAKKSGSSVDWAKLATATDTLVVLMGLKNLPRIASRLIAHGRAPETPVALIRSGTLGAQQVVISTLAEVGEVAQNLRPPVTAVIGDVVRLAHELGWYGGAGKAESPDSFLDDERIATRSRRA